MKLKVVQGVKDFGHDPKSRLICFRVSDLPSLVAAAVICGTKVHLIAICEAIRLIFDSQSCVYDFL